MKTKKWKPRKGERFYYPNPTYKNLVSYYEWSDHVIDYMLYERNLISKTKKEAIALAKAMLKVAERKMK